MQKCNRLKGTSMNTLAKRNWLFANFFERKVKYQILITKLLYGGRKMKFRNKMAPNFDFKSHSFNLFSVNEELPQN